MIGFVQTTSFFFFFVTQRLAEWVQIESVSAWPEKRGEIKKMMEMAAKDIEKLGGTVEMVDIGKQMVKKKSPGFDIEEVKQNC